MPTAASDSIFSFIGSISTPLQLGAFAIASGVFLVLRFRSQRHSALLKKITDLPADQREKALRTEMQQPTPPDMSAEQYLAFRLQQNRFWMRVVVLLGLLSVVILHFARDSKPTGDGWIDFFGCNSGTVSVQNAPAGPKAEQGAADAR